MIMTNLQPIYEQLGNLFYSIAAADNAISPKEISKLREEVEKHWVPLEDSTDRFGTDAAQYIGISFDYLLDEQIPTADEAWERFEAFYIDNRELFSHDLKHKILESAAAIANAYAGANKAELTRLSRLTLLFNK